MKLNTLSAHLVALLDRPLGDFTELQRALKEKSVHFDEKKNPLPVDPEELGRDSRLVDQIIGKPGPGGGIDADPFHTAFFLLAFALGSPRATVAAETWDAWHLYTSDSVISGWVGDAGPTFVRCQLTDTILFGEALKGIIADEALADRVSKVDVSMSGHWADIVFDSGNTRFSAFPPRLNQRFSRTATFSGDVLRIVANLINR